MKRPFLGRREIVFITFSVILVAILIIYLNLLVPLSFREEWKEIKIPEGITYREGINILKREGIIRNEFILLLSRITATDRKLRAGYYKLSASMSPWDIFNRLRKGRIIEYIIAIPEGSTLEDIKLKLMEVRLVDEESWQLVRDRDFLRVLDINAPSLEGYLYPDTYIFPKGIDPRSIFKAMVKRLRENINGSLMERAKEIGMSENKVLTLASIIEKEAQVDEERPLISAVYHNRLRRNMWLQADPTAIYGVKKMGAKITMADLRRQTPYNTYVIKGLPPGPIASPGIKSIKAALYPADIDYLYFVSRNDGTHHFSRTSVEHSRAVLLYQRHIPSGIHRRANNNDAEKKTN